MSIVSLPIAVFAPLLALVICAALIDAKERRIPNWLSGGGVLLAFGVHTALKGWNGAWFAAQGMIVGFALYLLLYLLRALGAGDVKLMAAVGAFAGSAIWMQIFLATALIGAGAAVFQAILKGRLGATIGNSGFIASELLHLRAPYVANSALDVKSPASLTLPHGVAIALGTCFYGFVTFVI